MQARTGTIISGSNAVQFMDRVNYEDADLDIYVNPGHGSTVGRHMVNIQGYRVVNLHGEGGSVTLGLNESIDHVIMVAMGAAREVVKAQYQQRSINILYNMEHITEEGRVLRVQVIVTSDLCVMNVITYNRAISFYPLVSFEFRRNQEMALYGASLGNTESARVAIQKYRRRGFEPGGYQGAADSRYHCLSNICSLSDPSRTLFQHGSDRKVGDRWCWTIRLDTGDVSPQVWVEDGPWEFAHEGDEGAGASAAEVRAQDPIMHNKWCMTGFLFILSPKYSLLRLPIFKYGYAVASNIKALWAREFSDEMAVAKSNGVFSDRRWFDDIIEKITEGSIIVGIEEDNEEEDGGAEIEAYNNLTYSTEDEQYGGVAYPMKVTEMIPNGELVEMLRRYSQAYQKEESEGREWCERRDKQRE
ncbi:hypothetical protein HWV62_19315 [Athelia sp. TMB]|nr:hypothetical protein HWV62_19315 [Athelia sp. TMB]